MVNVDSTYVTVGIHYIISTGIDDSSARTGSVEAPFETFQAGQVPRD